MLARLALCAVLGAAAPAVAAELACPPSVDLVPSVAVEAPPGWQARPGPERHVLSAARLFEGDPKEQADLVPDTSGKGGYAWKVGPELAGPTLVCAYEGTELTLQAPVPAGTKRCEVTSRKENARPMRGGRPVGDGTVVEARCR